MNEEGLGEAQHSLGEHVAALERKASPVSLIHEYTYLKSQPLDEQQAEGQPQPISNKRN